MDELLTRLDTFLADAQAGATDVLDKGADALESAAAALRKLSDGLKPKGAAGGPDAEAAELESRAAKLQELAAPKAASAGQPVGGLADAAALAKLLFDVVRFILDRRKK